VRKQPQKWLFVLMVVSEGRGGTSGKKPRYFAVGRSQLFRGKNTETGGCTKLPQPTQGGKVVHPPTNHKEQERLQQD